MLIGLSKLATKDLCSSHRPRLSLISIGILCQPMTLHSIDLQCSVCLCNSRKESLPLVDWNYNVDDNYHEIVQNFGYAMLSHFPCRFGGYVATFVQSLFCMQGNRSFRHYTTPFIVANLDYSCLRDSSQLMDSSSISQLYSGSTLHFILVWLFSLCNCLYMQA